MTLARVVAFDGVDDERIEEMRRTMRDNDPPEGLRPTELIILHDGDAEKALAIVFFANEEDYREGDAILGAMPAGDTPGSRRSVEKYEVAIRMTPS
jgi:hypothetical protein